MTEDNHTWAIPRRTLSLELRLGKPVVYDIIRKRWVNYTPEEAVRQQVLRHLVEDYRCAPGRIGVEKTIAYHGQKKRFDIVVFDKTGAPWLLIECKSPHVALDESTAMQIARYNVQIQAPFLALVNGRSWWFFRKNESGGFEFVPEGWVS